MKPILNETITNQVEDILAPFTDPQRWIALDLSFAPIPYAVVMLIGEPGTGKSTLARYMARRVSPKKLVEFSFGNVANSELGATETAINKIFGQVEKDNSPAILMDECDSVLWNRDLVNEHSIHMLSIVNTMLTSIDAFIKRGGMVCLATNHFPKLDPALIRRITDTITLNPLQGEAAARVWKAKLPRFVAPTKEEMQQLCLLPITPARIETTILSACRHAFRKNRNPIVLDLFHALSL